MIETHKEDEFNFEGAIKFIAMTLVTSGIIICGSLFLMKSCESETPSPVCGSISMQIVYPKPADPAIELVRAEIIKNGILEPEIVLAQSILETGHYTSKNCIERKNLFGMTGGVKTEDNVYGYKIYSDWRESIADYKAWQDRNFHPEYCGTYYDFLESVGYAESPEYCNKLRNIDTRN